MTQEEYEQFKIDSFNEAEGNLNTEDGYFCEVCRNKGILLKRAESSGIMYNTAYDCKCAPIRKSILKMKKSGLKDVVHDCTFGKWIATEPWQIAMKQAAVDYAKSPKGWFYVGGQPGCGKTHLCTAICRELLLSGKGVLYMQWREDSVKLKGLSKEPEQRQSLIDSFKRAEVLYIDDLFKNGRNPDRSAQRPTSADINLAFEIINYRYNNPDCLTIMSSELSVEEISNIDEAIGSRIYERATVLKIARNKDRNYRMKKEIEL